MLFLDLDGTVRHGLDELGRFVNDARDVHVFPEVPSLLASYRAAGWRICVVTNQGGIALGHLTEEECEQAIRETERQCGVAFDAVAICGHHPKAPELEDAICWCRKPRSGLVFYAIAALLVRCPGEAYPAHLGLMVGDRLEDRQCADGAALRFMLARDWRAGVHLPELVSARG